MIALRRPLVVLDLETTGTSVAEDRIVEIGLVRVDPTGTRTARAWRVNPGRPIPAAATAVHGIGDADVAGAPRFDELAEDLGAELAGVDLAGFNLRAFDLPLLRAEFARAGVAWPCDDAAVVDAFILFRERERHTLDRAVRLYCGREHRGAHRADADAAATLDVLLAQLAAYPDLPRDVDGLAAASGGRRPDWATECGRLRWNADGELVLGFSKHAGARLCDVDAGFRAWVLKGDFPDDVKALVRRVQRGERPRMDGVA